MRAFVWALLVVAGCQERVGEPPPSASAISPSPAVSVTATATAGPSVAPPTPVLPVSARTPLPAAPEVASDDPLRGKFTLAQATAGLSGEGELYAVMRTSAGNLVCELWPDKAPNTVANFVGLARGLRPYKKGGQWLKQPLYDGTEFYSVLRNFSIEGGSPGEKYNDSVGYFIPDETWQGAKHDQRGLLCMRAFTPNKSGSQFMILDGAATQLDGSFTIFGKCGPESVLDAISTAPVEAARPKPAIKLRKLEIVRSKQRPT
ncbi:MAG TPA: peptidylprolyl isomerase [Polyangiaceae bacterium]|nr:peptidylprolyl isomerase [Polyangiaceae bacterium]